MGNHPNGLRINCHLILILLPNEHGNNFINVGEKVMYPGLNQFLQELHEEWSATDSIEPVEPGAYYPPPRQGMHQHVEDGTTVAEVSMMDID